MEIYIDKVKSSLNNSSFYKKEILRTIKGQTITTTGVDSEGFLMTYDNLKEILNSVKKQGFTGNSKHYFSGSPKMIARNPRIVKEKDIYHLKVDVDIIDKGALEEIERGIVKGFSISFTGK